MDLVLATRNFGKIEQIVPILYGLPVTIKQLNETPVQGNAHENMSTIEANALKKAAYAWQRLDKGVWCLADDSGLFIDALNGAPGHHAARWAGKHALDEDIMAFTLRKLEGIPFERRGATFRTAAVLLAPSSGRPKIFLGQVRGTILEQPRGSRRLYMPYAQIFQPTGSAKVWAEMTTPEINASSHRGDAFRQVRTYLEGVL